MGDFTVRAATPKDFPAIRNLILNVHINPTGLKWRQFLVAVTNDDELIGCGQIKPHFDGSRELASIAVQEQARGHGVASAIIQDLMARETVRPLFLMCRARLESLYEKFGFVPIGPKEMPRYFRRISNLARILNSNARPENRLSVMKLS